MEHKRSEGVTYNTLRRYESMNRYYVTPTLGGVPIASLRALHVKDALRAWRSGGRNDRKKDGGLSDRTIHHCFTFLSAVMAEAVRDGKARANPCAAGHAGCCSSSPASCPNARGSQASSESGTMTESGLSAPQAAGLQPWR